jgi:hypothetical protein
MLTFETSQVQGAQAIIEKLTVGSACSRTAGLTPNQSLPFAKVQHKLTTLDAQPSSAAGGIMVLVTGKLLVSCHCGERCTVLTTPRSMTSSSP